MAVGAALAEPELDDRAWKIRDPPDGIVEAGELRLDAVEVALEAAHEGLLALTASRSCTLVCSRRRANSRMISMAICGNSFTRRKNKSLEMRKVVTLVRASTVALR